MHQYKITKYDPELYGAGGAYEGDDWTSMSEIGKEFDGAILTHSDYRRTESAYLEAIRLLASSSGVSSLEVRDLEVDEDSGVSVREGGLVTIDQGLELCRMMLREGPVWCKLENGERFYVHVGYDYYMYIGSSGNDASEISEIRESGLFVTENFPSPYID
ncbi:hypothetical protein [Saccharopolyspora sp. SCSIO 74807]|uniref:hypothetical protein n=1 Tax=Saccharopolyspora sp. SCSIO 74807 TaxID=3118084 RepID=UPI0030D22F65